MKIQCPKCKQPVPADQLNISTDLAYCPQCTDAFRISDSFDLEAVNAKVLTNPPSGTWYRKELDRVVVGASTRSPIAFFLVPFMCIWSGFSLGGIYGTQIVKGEFDLTSSLFGIPFILGSFIFWTFALMAVCGKVEVIIGRESFVFVGIESLGWKRKINWTEIHTIREDNTFVRYPGGNQCGILLEGKSRIKFGTGLNEQRHYFVLHALKYLRAQTR